MIVGGMMKTLILDNTGLHLQSLRSSNGLQSRRDTRLT